jgi:ADP-dependent NAD(P)H-hydrate dehydratase / NAD(P)H-hydrate epimerase
MPVTPKLCRDGKEEKHMFTCEYLLTGKEMTEADSNTSRVLGIPSLVLMERAALGVAERIRRDYDEYPGTVRAAVVAGKGNNGADALAAGRLLLDAGYEVAFFLTFARERIGTKPAGEEKQAPSSLETQLQILDAYKAEIKQLPKDFASLQELRPQVILDGIFGTGLSREITETTADAVRCINELRSGRAHEKGDAARVYAVDLPSGISADTGKVLGTAVKADVTITFSFYKKGQFLYPGCEHCGELVRFPIGITDRSLSEMPQTFTYRWEENAGEWSKNRRKVSLLPARKPNGNKGTFGKVLVIAGSKGVSGACILCARTALRAGAGMVRVFTHESNRIIVQEMVPEAMCDTYENEKESSDRIAERLEKALLWADVVVAGPGMGVTAAGAALLQQALTWGARERERSDERSRAKTGTWADGRRGLVLDADALRLIARNRWYERLREAGEESVVILTPHPGEAAALLDITVSELKENVEEAFTAFAASHHCTVIAKDARTRVISHESRQIYLNTTGNDGLATAGSGDVLAGLTGGLLAQRIKEPREQGETEGFWTACAAVCLHGRLAELCCVKQGTGSVIATDLIQVIPTLYRKIQYEQM